MYKKYEEVQTHIDELTDDETDTSPYRQVFEQEYFNVVAQAEALLARGRATQQLLGASTNEERSAESTQESHARVPFFLRGRRKSSHSPVPRGDP